MSGRAIARTVEGLPSSSNACQQAAGANLNPPGLLPRALHTGIDLLSYSADTLYACCYIVCQVGDFLTGEANRV